MPDRVDAKAVLEEYNHWRPWAVPMRSGIVPQLWDALSQTLADLEAAESKLRSEFRCRGLTDAEIAAEFAALAGKE